MRAHRRGKVILSGDTLRRYDRAARIFDGLVVWSSETNMMTDKVTYWAEHRDFDEVPEAEVIPEYEAILSDTSVQWRRIDAQEKADQI